MKALVLPICMALLAGHGVAQTITRHGAMEAVLLTNTNDAKAWAVAECTVQPASDRVKATTASWHWHIDVDHFSGEPNYPIGWPRISHAIPAGALRDWSAWDFLRVWVYVETSRSALPHEPVGLGIAAPDRASTYSRVLGELRPGQWVQISVPTSVIPRPTDVRSVQFHIAEANYRHGDRVDVYLDELALWRYVEPTLVGLVAETAILYSDARQLALRVQMLGVKPDEQVAVDCELVRQTEVLVRRKVQASRGSQRVVLVLPSHGLAPGDYALRATAPGGGAQSTPVRVVESPWK